MLDRNPMTAPALRSTISPSADLVMGALRGAADRTGTDFDYLLTTAMRESSLNPEAKASTSSATGLFQFIEQTWLGTMRQHGASHGLSAYAEAIKPGKDGRLTVADKAMRQEILALRKNPEIAAIMAGELTNDARNHLEGALGRGVSAGELYVAHFLGPQAAVKMIRAGAQTPSLPAASFFPDAASANTRIFYTKGGEARSVAAVLETLKARHDGASAGTQFAAAPKAAQSLPPARVETTEQRGTFPFDNTSPAMPASSSLEAALSMDGMVMSPLLAQILASVDTLPSFARAFGPLDDADHRQRAA
ncbi:MAG: transglycosylase SLT domain-containing protein [Alphaproteobacteria bacterium]